MEAYSLNGNRGVKSNIFFKIMTIFIIGLFITSSITSASIFLVYKIEEDSENNSLNIEEPSWPENWMWIDTESSEDNVNSVNMVDVDTECQQHGYDWGIAKYQCGSTTPEETGSGWAQGYSLSVIWNQCISANWTSNLYVCGVLSKEATNYYDNPGGLSGSVVKHGQQDISHITFCGCDDEPFYDIQIEKSVWDDTIMDWTDSVTSTVNEHLSFMLNITNIGNQNLTNINISDTLPNLLLYNYDATGSPVVEQNHYIEWQLFSLQPQESVTLYYTATCLSTGVGDNIAIVNSDQNTTSEDQVNITVEEAPLYQIDVEKMAWDITSSEWVSTIDGFVGTNITFMINVSNIGDTVLTDIIVLDTLPTFLVYNFDATGSPVVEQDHYVEWFISSLSPQSYQTYTFTAYLESEGAGYNIANASNDQTNDEDLVYVSSTETPIYSIDIEKFVWNETSGNWQDSITAYVGTNLTFMINITNTGNAILTNINISDILPSFVTYNYDATGIPIVEQDHYIEWLILSMNPQETLSYTYTASLEIDGEGYNIAHVTTEQAVEDEDLVFIDADQIPNPEIVITKQAWNTSASRLDGSIQGYVGDNITFTITILNTGNVILTNLVLDDVLPSFIVYNYDATGNPVIEQDHYIEWHIDSLAPQESITFTYTAALVAEGQEANIATVHTDDQSVSDEDLVDITSEDLPTFEVNIEKTVFNESSGVYEEQITAYTNTTLSFMIIVTNMGNTELTNLFIQDTLPDFLFYNYDANPSATIEQDHYIEWHIDSLLPQETIVLTYTADLESIGNDANIAFVYTADQGVSDEDTVDITSVDPPTYLITTEKYVFNEETSEWVDGIEVIQGTIVRFKIIITNDGTGTLTNIEISDTLSSHMEYLAGSATVTPASYDAHSIIWVINSLNPGESISIEFEANTTGIGEGTNYVISTTSQGATSNALVCVTIIEPPVYHIETEKYVYNSETNQWVKGIGVEPNTIVRFKIIVTNEGTMTLTNIHIEDTLSEELAYYGNPTVIPDSSSTHSVTWSKDELIRDESFIIEFEAKTILTAGIGTNYVQSTAEPEVDSHDFAYVFIDYDDYDSGDDDCFTPVLQIISPESETVNGIVTIQWYAVNSDYPQNINCGFKPIPIYMYISGNNGKTWKRLGPVHSNNIDNDHGSYQWDTNTVSDGTYILRAETWNHCWHVGRDYTKPFYVDNGDKGMKVSHIDITDITINSKTYIKSGDTAKITATISGTLAEQLTADDITADLTYFGDSIRKADSYDLFEASWIVDAVELKNKEGPITITILIDGEIKGSCTIIADDIEPELSITKPDGGGYFFNKRFSIFPLDKSIIIGKSTIELETMDNYEIKKVEFYADGVYLDTITKDPYSYVLNLKGMGQTINLQVITHDIVGNTAIDQKKIVLYNPFGQAW